MTPASAIDRDTFLDNLRQSGLVGETDLASLASLQPDLTRGKQYARLLIERGALTRFQAERLLAGQTAGFLLGPYRILDLLGQGGMGRVYKAEHRTMKRVVALKVLANAVLQSERAVQLFLHEVRAVGVLQHRNIVVAYDANEVNGRYYLVLEYVDGPNLDQLVRRRGPLPVGLACDYIRQAALGLQFAHELGMVHRDIKPANILLQTRGGGANEGVIKVSDFGLARLASPPRSEPVDVASPTIMVRDNTVMGTPDYLSPEQSRDLHKTDIRSDLYSLGCSFHYLLTGEVPYPGGSSVEKIIRHATETPKPISAFRGDVPEAVATIVRLLMNKRPEDRFSSPAELVEALEAFAVHGSASWAPASPLSGELAAVERSTDELAALAATDAVPMGDTPHAVSPSRIIVRPRPRETRPVGLAVAIAVSIAFGMVALVLVLALILAR
jgi:eukaryotic-like serine/threonine-protein kinase